MQLSTDLPCGAKAISAYLVTRKAGSPPIPANVGLAADEAYTAEKGIQTKRPPMDAWPIGSCARCAGVIHNAPFAKAGKKYCSRSCRDNVAEGSPKSSNEPIARTCQGCGRGFITTRRRENRVFHSDDCHANLTEKFSASGVMPTGWKACGVCGGPFLPEFGTERYCARKACAKSSARERARQAA
jgi:hypothetical protein